jgi:hypothetical protein
VLVAAAECYVPIRWHAQRRRFRDRLGMDLESSQGHDP